MKVIHFDKAEELENSLARHITEDLSALVHEYGHAALLVSGGSSPIGLFKKLAQVKFNWKRVRIALVDERLVPVNDEHSNELLVRTHLLGGLATKVPFTGMIYDPSSEANNLELAREQYREIINSGSYISILGMGNDGHTASLFPGDPASEIDLNGEHEATLINTSAPGIPHKRISCNKELILSSKKIYLLLSGKTKLDVLNEAPDKNLPIARFITAQHIETYFSEQKL